MTTSDDPTESGRGPPRFRILGALEVDDRTDQLGPPKQRALLGFFLLHPDEVITTDRLMDALWGEAPPPTAQHSIQTYVSGLRSVLGSTIIRTAGHGYRLPARPGDIDASLFEDRLKAALANPDPRQRVTMLTDVLDLWRGPVLVDVDDHLHAHGSVARLDDLHLVAWEAWAEAARSTGSVPDLVGKLEELIELHPFRELLWKQLILALDQSGRRADALRAFKRLETLLGEELGIDPSSELKAVEEEILFQTAHKSSPPDRQEADPTSVSEPEGSRSPAGGENPPAPADELSTLRRRTRLQGLALGVVAALLLSAVAVAAWPRLFPRPIAGLLHEVGGDAGFTDVLVAGFEQAATDQGFATEHRVVSEDAATTARRMCESGVRVLVLGGEAVHDAIKVADDYPGVRFIALDSITGNDRIEFGLSNVTPVEFDPGDGAFLMGAAAALESQSGAVGFVGGPAGTAVDSSLAGFEAGARAADPSVRVVASYVTSGPGSTPASEALGAFELGYRSAVAVIEGGADVVFHSAGVSGSGVLGAITSLSTVERPLLLIGPDVNEWIRASERDRAFFLTSVLKRGDIAASWLLFLEREGMLDGSPVTVGLAENAVGFASGGGPVAPHLETIDRLRSDVLSGTLEIPDQPSDQVVWVGTALRTEVTDDE